MFPEWYSEGGYWTWALAQADEDEKKEKTKMAEGNGPAFKVRAKNGKTKEQFDLFVGFQQRGDFEGFDVSPAKDWSKDGGGLGVPKVTIVLEYPGGVKRRIVLDPANKASDHYLTLYDNRNRAAGGSRRAPEGSEEEL